MSSVTAYYNGSAFIPVEPVDINAGEIVKLTVIKDESKEAKITRKMAAFRRITRNLQELNETEPLPPEFDKIIAQGVNFTREIELP